MEDRKESYHINRSHDIGIFSSRRIKFKRKIHHQMKIIILLALAYSMKLFNCTPLPQDDTTNRVLAGKKPLQIQQQADYQTRAKRAATARQDRLWDDAVIPYEIDPSFSDERAALFRSAMRHWENYTCIKYVERIPNEHPNYIVFTERSCGCCSFVGKRGSGAQAISIGKHCDKFGIVVHELGHVVGFWHEHTRPDRDQHVQIINKNIMAGQEYNFNKLTKDEVNSLGLAYDYDSILHYATNTFAKDTYLDTILPLHGHLNTEETGLSQGSFTAVTGNQVPTNSTPAQFNNQTIISTGSGSSSTNAVVNESLSSTLNNRGQSKHHQRQNFVPVRNTTSQSPHMINDEPGNLQERLEKDFQSMLQFDAGLVERRKQEVETSKLMLLDGRVVVSVGGSVSVAQSLSQKGTVKKTKRESIDVDDGLHFLAMDNMLAKTRPEIGQRVRLSVGDIAQTNLLYKCPKCGKTIQQNSGLFHSPGYYSVQGQDKKIHGRSVDSADNGHQHIEEKEKEFCEWRLSVGSGERILLNITDLDLSPSTFAREKPIGSIRLGMPRSALKDDELSDIFTNIEQGDLSNPLINTKCFNDYLEIRDGYTYKAPLLAKLCGSISALTGIIKPIISSGNRLLVSFRSSSSIGNFKRRGFLAQHETLCGGTIMLGDALYGRSQIATYNILSQTSTNDIRQQTDRGTINGINQQSNSNHRSVINGSSPIENEVLLSSQTNFRYHSHLQSQQSEVRSNRSSENLTNGFQTSNSTQSNSLRDYSWVYWPEINSSTIQSPNWPEHYGASKECTWQVLANENHQISLKFDAFDLEPHDACAYDYVEIRDGDFLRSNLLGKFCGNRVPEVILSSGPSLLLKFVSDSDVNRAGFLARLQPELDECKLGTHGCSYRCSNAVIPYRCECPEEFELALDKKRCVPTCGGLKNDSTGIITSPSYPDLYPIDTKCVWEIFAPAHHRVILNFTDFELEGTNSQECEYDYLDIRSELSDGKYIKTGTFCGSNQTQMISSVTNMMRLEFNSDNTVQKRGFKAHYFFDNDECAINNGDCQHICINTVGSYRCTCSNGFILHEDKRSCTKGHCTHTISSPEGTFQSPNFPKPYQANQTCAWAFSTAPGHRIKLIFDQFDLESNQACAYDNVSVFDGESANDPPLGRFCGSRRPLTLMSSFNMLYLSFESDGTNERRGFNATHSTVCGGRLQASPNQNDLIFSHPQFDGTTHYNRNEDCVWLIEANYNQRVKIEFNSFALEPDTNCNYDVVVIYDGIDESSQQLARLCGLDLPKELLKLTSSSESMLIVFRSDDSINNRGFSLTYTAIEIIEDETPVAPSKLYSLGAKHHGQTI